MKYLNLLAFTSLIALAATDIPDELNSEELQNIPVDAVDEISDALERDNFMTADEAKKFGLIDSVVEKRK